MVEYLVEQSTNDIASKVTKGNCHANHFQLYRVAQFHCFGRLLLWNELLVEKELHNYLGTSILASLKGFFVQSNKKWDWPVGMKSILMYETRDPSNWFLTTSQCPAAASAAASRFLTLSPNGKHRMVDWRGLGLNLSIEIVGYLSIKEKPCLRPGYFLLQLSYCMM